MLFKSVLFFAVLVTAINGTHCWVVQTQDTGNELPEEVPEPVSGKQRLSLIVPGTKWCGSGNISSGYDDLGRFKETDKCCREHDYCDDLIEAGETKYNLTNNSFYTKLNCACDQTFYDCLRATESVVSNNVGTVYFNVLGTECYREEYKIVGCKTYVKKRCVEYDYEEGSEKSWQWFDVPIY